MVEACPSCQSSELTKVKFTWWGGFIGPKIINTVKCNDCGKSFNGKTGGSNTVPIIIYTVVILAVVLLFTVMGSL